MKTEELAGAPLDAAVARIEGVTGLVEKDGRMCHEITWDPEARHWRDDVKAFKMWVDYAPSQRWEAGGPIIERERITVMNEMDVEGSWVAGYEPEASGTGIAFMGGRPWGGSPGPTPLVAAMRAYVAKRFGEEVPDEPAP